MAWAQPSLSSHTGDPEASTRETFMRASLPHAWVPPLKTEPGKGRLEEWNDINLTLLCRGTAHRLGVTFPTYQPARNLVFPSWNAPIPNPRNTIIGALCDGRDPTREAGPAPGIVGV